MRRRSDRATAGKTNKYDAYSLVTTGKRCGVADLPEVGLALANLSVKNALETHGKMAFDAIKDELTQLFVTKEALKLVKWKDIPRKSTEVRSHMFLKLKVDANGVPEKLKARLVADGSSQDRSRYEVYEVLAPTASLPSIMNVLKIAVQEGREYMVFDIAGAYLNSQMKEIIYLIITDKRLLNILRVLFPNLHIYLDQYGRAIAKVDRALYGLIEAANLWNKTLTKVLTDDGFVVNECDPCVLNRTSAGLQTTVVIYVDDLLVSSKDITHIRAVKNLIELHFDEVKQKSGTSVTYLGMNLMKVHDNIKGFYSLEISMIGFTESILQEWNGHKLYPYSIPADDKLFYVNPSQQLNHVEAKRFHKSVAQLLYLCKRSRVDIALAVHFLCTRVKEPTVDDKTKLLRVLGYLESTIHMPRIIRRDETFPSISSYIDAAFAVHSDGKGHSGGVVLLGDTVVDVVTRKQKRASSDSTEAELIAISDLSTDVLWASEWMRSQGHIVSTPMVYQDNTSTIHLITQGGGKWRSKQMRALIGAVKQNIDDENFDVSHKGTDEMISDAYTKPVGGEIFKRFRSFVMGHAKRLIRSMSAVNMRSSAGVRCKNEHMCHGSSCHSPGGHCHIATDQRKYSEPASSRHGKPLVRKKFSHKPRNGKRIGVSASPNDDVPTTTY